MPVADLGVMAAVTDPSGAFIGFWQPGTHKGFGRVAEVGAPCWHELHTRDYAAALGFYRTVLGWETKEIGDTDEFRYTQAMSDGEPFAGVMDARAWLPEGVPSHWTVYFGVADADAACAAVPELGGAVVEAPTDTPYGRIATVTDPTGTLLRIVTA
jgi:predicted enzyme related to lactoylglutathione lyase